MSDSTFKEKYVLEKFLMYFLGLTREDLWTKSNEEIADFDLKKILEAYKKYVEDKQPMEYILGFVEFFDKKFFVDKNTLIPRPETEYMILAVSEYISQKGMSDEIKGRNVLIDLGTGCGVLGISVLLQNKGVFDDVFFTDISDGALSVAKKNYDSLVLSSDNNFNVKFLKSDLLSFLDNENLENVENMVIVANLPYIPDEMFDENSPDNVKNYEPRFAFVGGEDGLDLYRKMLSMLSILESNLVMFLEMMTWQVDILRKEFDRLEFEEVKTFHFNIRIVKCMRSIFV